MQGVDRLVIEQDKLDGYLLNLDHVDGGSKAKFFLSRGFRRDAPLELGNALASHAEAYWPGRLVENSFVAKHIVIGPMSFPDGSTRDVLAIWKIISGHTAAQFVTAYPNKNVRSKAAKV